MKIPSGDKEFQEISRTMAGSFLLGSGGLELRKASYRGLKRVTYVKGNKLMEWVKATKIPHCSLPTEQSRQRFIEECVKKKLFRKCQILDKQKRSLIDHEKKIEYDPKAFYVMTYEGQKSRQYTWAILFVAVVISCCLLPMWPNFMKVGLWYLSVTLLILMLGFVVVRGLLFSLLWAVGYDFWILPNIFRDDIAFCETFRPFISFEPSEEGQGLVQSCPHGLHGRLCLCCVHDANGI